jgi:hypothetical protein
MIEAWQIEHRPLLYAILRRFELCRWVLFGKHFHESASWWARVRALWIVLGGHETEICCLCGRGVNAVWWCQDGALWEQVTGWIDGGGVSCMACFERAAVRQSVFLKWTATVEGGYEEETLKQKSTLPSEKEAGAIETGKGESRETSAQR